jgi:hypothetical protein
MGGIGVSGFRRIRVRRSRTRLMRPIAEADRSLNSNRPNGSLRPMHADTPTRGSRPPDSL